MQYPLPHSVLIPLGEKAALREVDAIDAKFVHRFDTVEVKLGASCLLLTFADAADLVDKLAEALDARTSSLRVVA
ncbi:hypothetical protein ACFWVM_01720 [Nocardia fluminea]|uniref:hypothetical protein n=1 Tax=Nocardia TaxID=1817 RepID=UPI002659145C|nr:hypothetical protein [Nocardia sp. PE-7]WKG11701.1 hypothetical protein QX204_09685 [Nocardia sp. PE-7]